MTTGPSGIDPIAATGFSAAAAAYRRSRPSWPREAIDSAFSHWGLDPEDGLVVDVGAGTGLLTEQLAARCSRLLAVEPVEAMRRHIVAAPAVAGTAEALPLRDGEALAIFAGEAFHWFDRAAALAEAARVLRAGGGLAVMWNHPLPDGQPWREELDALVAPHHYHASGLAPDAGDPRDVRDWQTGPEWEAFEPLAYLEIRHRQLLTRTAAVDRIASLSYVGALDEPTRRELLARVDALLARYGVSSYEQHWRCDVHLTRRRARTAVGH